MRWYIGDGLTIWIWQNPWLPNGTLHSYLKGPLLSHEDDRRVSELWSDHAWLFESLSLLFLPSSTTLFKVSGPLCSTLERLSLAP